MASNSKVRARDRGGPSTRRPKDVATIEAALLREPRWRAHAQRLAARLLATRELVATRSATGEHVDLLDDASAFELGVLGTRFSLLFRRALRREILTSVRRNVTRARRAFRALIPGTTHAAVAPLVRAYRQIERRIHIGGSAGQFTREALAIIEQRLPHITQNERWELVALVAEQLGIDPKCEAVDALACRHRRTERVRRRVTRPVRSRPRVSFRRPRAGQ